MSELNDTCDDLLQEYRALAACCATLTPQQWGQTGPFYGWTPWDEIAHLCYFDEAAVESATDPEAFARNAQAMLGRVMRGEEISTITRQYFAGLDGAALLERWRQGFERLVALLRGLDPKARLAWYGPSMGARSFVAARLMEVWAHGQDVWDTLRQRRPASHRLRYVAHLGATTFGWTFANRRLAVPATVPHIELAAPDGSLWSWGEPDAMDFVKGSAEDFCLVVTQRRHVDDTGLQYSAGLMRQWLELAQCFAGPPADGPAPGVRKIAD